MYNYSQELIPRHNGMTGGVRNHRNLKKYTVKSHIYRTQSTHHSKYTRTTRRERESIGWEHTLFCEDRYLYSASPSVINKYKKQSRSVLVPLLIITEMLMSNSFQVPWKEVQDIS